MLGEMQTDYWFRVCWFLGSKDSCFIGFKVSWFQNYERLKDSMIPYSRIPILLIDIDPISNISKNLLGGSSGFPGVRLFHFVLKRLSGF